MDLTRRTLLRTTAAAAPLLLAPRGLALDAAFDPDANVLVMLRLGGGNDGLNTLVPRDDDAYRRARATLALPSGGLVPFHPSLGLHASLAPLREMIEASRVAIVSNAGSPLGDRSHFKSLDTWHSGSLEDHPRHGFLAPLIDAGDERSAFGGGVLGVLDDALPLALIGRRRAAPSLRSLDDARLDDPAAVLGSATPRATVGESLAALLAAGDQALALAARLAEVDADRLASTLPRTALGRALATTLALLAAGIRPRVLYLAHDGFDTHVRQADTHAALLADLAHSLAAFFAALPQAIDPRRVLVLTFSEFGRRVAENGSRGTDHGKGAPQFLFGDAVAAGLIGTPPDLLDLDEGDVRCTIDFRQIYSTLLERWLSADPVAALGSRLEPLPLLA
jgi:uncharacterized protein (DUF1501 family)